MAIAIVGTLSLINLLIAIILFLNNYKKEAEIIRDATYIFLIIYLILIFCIGSIPIKM